MKKYLLLLLAGLAAMVIVSCGGRPDLAVIPLPNYSGANAYCNTEDNETLTITVKNQDSGDATIDTTTTVTFSTQSGDVVVDLTTPALPSGDSVDLMTKFPAGCFDSDCGFKIAVDSKGQLDESDESDNTATGLCIG